MRPRTTAYQDELQPELQPGRVYGDQLFARRQGGWPDWIMRVAQLHWLHNLVG